jgi:hypothetical protein
MSNKKNIFLLSILIISVGALLRYYQINFENYWFDEINDFWITDPNISLDATFSRRESIGDVSPYLWESLLKMYFKIFGYIPEIGRYFPLFFGILSIPFIGILSYQVKKDNSFLLTILLISINIYLIKYSQETRVYSLVFLLATINLIFYYKIISLDLTFSKKIYIFLLFTGSSILNFSTHPFLLIIFFSQVACSIYAFFILKNKNLLFFLSIPFILIIYIFTNYDYLLSNLSITDYFVKHENWKFYYNFYFSRFFGSKIMGLIYLSTLIFLIINFRKKILFTSNNYLPLIFVLFFSYLIPLSYGLIRHPILIDRYIIFVLIPIIILLSSLITEIDNKKLRISLLVFILVPTLINNYIEIKYRINTKPEFTKIIDNLNEHENKNISIYTTYEPNTKMIESYIKSTKKFKNKNLNILNINNLPSDIKAIWVICYEPVVGFNCAITNNNKSTWILRDTKKAYLVNAKLYEINN